MHIAITGASSGIGLALAKELAHKGNQLTLVARRMEILESLARESPCPTRVYGTDLSILETCANWVSEAEQVFGPLDLLINNAGVQYVEPALGIGDLRGEFLLRLNLLCPLRLINRVLPGMVARKSGTLVNIASTVALVYTPWMTYYGAAKAGLAAASETLRVELCGTGVHVLTVYPGPVATPMEKAARAKFAQSALVAMLPTGQPKILARLIQRAIVQQKARVIYPRVYTLLRYNRVLSQWLTDRFTPALQLSDPEEKPG